MYLIEAILKTHTGAFITLAEAHCSHFHVSYTIIVMLRRHNGIIF